MSELDQAVNTDDDLQALIDAQGGGDSPTEDDGSVGVIEIDVSDAQDPFEPATAGNYRLRIDKYAIGTAKSSGSPMIKPEFTIILAHDPNNTNHVGKKVFENWVISGDGGRFGKFRHRQTTEALGLPLKGGPVAAYINGEIDVELVIEPGDAQNRAKNRINNIFKVK